MENLGNVLIGIGVFLFVVWLVRGGNPFRDETIEETTQYLKYMHQAELRRQEYLIATGQEATMFQCAVCLTWSANVHDKVYCWCKHCHQQRPDLQPPLPDSRSI